MTGSPERPRILPAEARLLLVLTGLGLAMFTLSRLGLAILFHDRLEPVPLRDTLAAFAVGMLVDLGFLAWLLLPVWVLCFLPRLHWAERRGVRAVLVGWIAFCMFGLLVGMVSDLLHYKEFDARLNGMSLDYLRQPVHLAVVLHHEFGLLPVGTAMALVTWGVARIALRRLSAMAAAAARGRTRVLAAAVTCALLVLACAGSVFRSRTAQAAPYFSDSYAARQLAMNGTYNFMHAWLDELTDEELSRARFEGIPEDEAVRVVRRLTTGPRDTYPPPDPSRSRRSSPLWRQTDTGRARRDLNVVLVMMESFDARGIGALGGRKGDSPCFDRLASAGVLHTRHYAAGTRTNRGLAAVLSSMPTPSAQSALRSPAVRPGGFSLGAALRDRGYATLAIYGGDRDYDNLDAYLAANGFDRMIGWEGFEKPAFATEWGVCDEEVFDRALAEFDGLAGQDRPFLGFVLTLSNHRPYRVPPGRVKGVPRGESSPRDDPGPAVRDTFRYADWALGRFMDEARQRPWFANTLFVFVADHGNSGHSSLTPDVASFRVPLLLYAPEVLEPDLVDGLSSQLDVAPTVLGLLGGTFSHASLGRDLGSHEGPGWAVLAMADHLLWLETGQAVLWGPEGGVERYGFDGTQLVRPDISGLRSRPATETDGAGGIDGLTKLRAMARVAHTLQRGGGFGRAASTDSD